MDLRNMLFPVEHHYFSNSLTFSPAPLAMMLLEAPQFVDSSASGNGLDIQKGWNDAKHEFISGFTETSYRLA